MVIYRTLKTTKKPYSFQARMAHLQKLTVEWGTKQVSKKKKKIYILQNVFSDQNAIKMRIKKPILNTSWFKKEIIIQIRKIQQNQKQIFEKTKKRTNSWQNYLRKLFKWYELGMVKKQDHRCNSVFTELSTKWSWTSWREMDMKDNFENAYQGVFTYKKLRLIKP